VDSPGVQPLDQMLRHVHAVILPAPATPNLRHMTATAGV
jgi:hypothetical protein